MSAVLARCALHPENAAVGSCSRCGAFVCAADHSIVFGKLYCHTCASRPEIDYLEALRLKYWGRRDSWAWLVGVSAFSYLAAAGFYVFVQQQYVSGLIAAAGSVICAFYWLGHPWARLVILLVPVCFGAQGLVTGRPELLGAGVFGLLILATPLSDTRNALFFRRPVTAHALQKYWDLYMNNRAARNGAMLAIASLLMPIFLPFAIGYCIVGLLRVDPNATPPIGKRWYAVFGLVLSALLSVGWGSIVISRWR